jgi:hypothetical protein
MCQLANTLSATKEHKKHNKYLISVCAFGASLWLSLDSLVGISLLKSRVNHVEQKAFV